MPPLAALEALDDALAATRSFLLPFDRTRWAVLALLAFFVGGPGAFVPPLRGATGVEPGPPGGGPGELPFDPELGRALVGVAVAAVVVVLGLGLAFAFVAAIMEFALVQSLRTRTVAVRRYVGAYWRRGVVLFAFRLVLGAVAVAAVAVLLLPPVLATFGGFTFSTGFLVAFYALSIPVVLLLGAVLAVANGFTTAFVVPVMLRDDCGLLAGWRRLWRSLLANPSQYGAYLVVSVVLSTVAVAAVGSVAGIAAVVLLVPFAVLFGLGAAALAALGDLLGLVVLAAVAVLYGVSLLVVVAVVRVPVIVYLRYYALLVLGDVDPGLDPIPDQRAELRAADGPDDAEAAGG